MIAWLKSLSIRIDPTDMSGPKLRSSCYCRHCDFKEGLNHYRFINTQDNNVFLFKCVQLTQLKHFGCCCKDNCVMLQ